MKESLVVYISCADRLSEHQIYIYHEVFGEKTDSWVLQKWANFLELIISKGHSQEDTLKVLWAMIALYVFHGHHFEKQSSVGCINPIFGPVVLLQFWLNLITFQWHLVYVSDVAASSLDKGLPIHSPVSPGQCTGVTCTDIRLGTGSSVAKRQLESSEHKLLLIALGLLSNGIWIFNYQ